MEQYIIKDGKQLRLGYTTGSCAAAAAKAAAWMLLSGKEKDSVSLLTPKGIALHLQVEKITFGENFVSCAIEKDSGDDPDVTKGALIFAEVRKTDIPGITIDGGFGVGRVTKPGLDQPVGNAAINSVPRRMISENVQEVMDTWEYPGGLSVTISVPLGQELAKKTFNPRLGIVGGISILGTTGIVEPMSETALIETIRVELTQKRANGADYVLLTPGNYGAEFIRDVLKLDPNLAVQTSNFIGDSIDICKELGFRGALLIGHIGKLVKLGGNMMNTHSKYGDCRLPILASCAGAEGLPPAQIARMLECVSCDDGLKILTEENLVQPTMRRLIFAIHYNLQYRAGDALEMGCATFSKEYGMLGTSPNAEALAQKILADYEDSGSRNRSSDFPLNPDS